MREIKVHNIVEKRIGAGQRKLAWYIDGRVLEDTTMHFIFDGWCVVSVMGPQESHGERLPDKDQHQVFESWLIDESSNEGYSNLKELAL